MNFKSMITDKMFVGICIGIRPDNAAEMEEDSYEAFHLTRVAIYDRISELLFYHVQGYVAKREDACIHLMVFFDREEKENLYESRIRPIQKRVEKEYQTKLLIGIGMPSSSPEQMKNAYRTARYAFDLYFFEERSVILFQEIHKSFKKTNEAFYQAVEDIFHSIVANDEEAIKNVENALVLIGDMFYGNRFATENRCMHLTGMIAERLVQYKMIQTDFYELQDELQENLVREVTYRGVKDVILCYYRELLCHISEVGRTKNSALIGDIKHYIRMHYMENLSIERLAGEACVSKNYFSAMFKKETGMNYKKYLTQIRMEKALKLLQETDDKTYEISEKVGYQNVRRFVEAFRKIYSVTPAEYRKALRGV